jgi:hypothetical protein
MRAADIERNNARTTTRKAEFIGFWEILKPPGGGRTNVFEASVGIEISEKT